jgi:hypothetical protein
MVKFSNIVDKIIRITREELYQLVWSKPRTKLAREFGISDVALGKICKKLNVPKPYLGYWRQFETGRQIQPPPLPKINKGIPTEAIIHPKSKPKESFQLQNPEILAKIEAEGQVNNRISITKDLRNAHPLTSRTRQILEKAKPDDYGRLRTTWEQRDQPRLDLRVSKGTLHRALLIMDALLKALEERGCSVEISKKEDMSTQIVIGEQKVRVYIWENADRRERSEKELAEIKKRSPSWMSTGRWVFTPSGKLMFVIDEYWSSSGRRRWSDSKRKPLEDMLNELIVGVVIAAEGLRIKEIERQEEKRKWEEMELRRLEEENRRDLLEEQSKLWIRAQNLRTFLKEYENMIRSSPVFSW